MSSEIYYRMLNLSQMSILVERKRKKKEIYIYIYLFIYLSWKICLFVNQIKEFFWVLDFEKSFLWQILICGRKLSLFSHFFYVVSISCCIFIKHSLFWMCYIFNLVGKRSKKKKYNKRKYLFKQVLKYKNNRNSSLLSLL